MAKKKISVMIPCYNEEENARPIYEAVCSEMKRSLPEYDYEILFIDNCSQDRTQQIIEEICAEDKHVKAIFNAKNFGQFNSPYYGVLQTSGDCTIILCADFQDPVELIPVFVREWEKGYKIVCGIKTASKENGFVYFLRSCYYTVIKKMSNVEQIEHFTGFGLYDKSFVQVLRDLKDPTPFIRGIVAELGYERKDIEYTQPQRRAGKTHNNWYSLYDAAMLSFTSYTKSRAAPRHVRWFSDIGNQLFAGIGLSGDEARLLGPVHRRVGTYAHSHLLFWRCSTVFIGLLGEYIMSMNARIMNRPLVVEEKRLNFEKQEERDGKDTED